MCEPVTIGVGLALMAGSMYAKSEADAQVEEERRHKTEAEMDRQTQFDKEASIFNDASRDRYVDFRGQQDAKSKQVADYFKSQSAPMGASAPSEIVPTSSNVTVQNEVAKQKQKTKAFGEQQDTALGGLRGFGDLLGGISLKQAADAGKVGQIGGFKRGSYGVLPFELEAANHAGDGTRMLGDLLGYAGTAVSMYGMGAGAAGSVNASQTTTAPMAGSAHWGM